MSERILVEREALRRLVHGEHAAAASSRSPSSPAPRLIYSRGAPAGVQEETDGAQEQKYVIFLNRTIEERLAGPRPASMSPLESCTTAWNTRSPFRVGMTPFEITVPITVASSPIRSFAIDDTVLASSYRCGMCRNKSRAVNMPSRRNASARAGPTPVRNVTAVSSDRSGRPPDRGRPRNPEARCALTGRTARSRGTWDSRTAAGRRQPRLCQ